MMTDIKIHKKICEYKKNDLAEKNYEESKESLFGLAGINLE